MLVPVWVDAWQFECCGGDFKVGDEVRWRLVWRHDDPWLEHLLGPAYPDWRVEVAVDPGPEPPVGVAAGLRVTLLGDPDLGAGTYPIGMPSEDHHLPLLDAVAGTAGSVRRIEAVHCREDPVEAAPVLPQAGCALLTLTGSLADALALRLGRTTGGVWPLGPVGMLVQLEVTAA